LFPCKSPWFSNGIDCRIALRGSGGSL